MDVYSTHTTTPARERASEVSSATASSLRAQKELAKTAHWLLLHQKLLPQTRRRSFHNKVRSHDHLNLQRRYGHDPLAVAIDLQAATGGHPTPKHCRKGETAAARRPTPRLNDVISAAGSLHTWNELTAWRSTSSTLQELTAWRSSYALMTGHDFGMTTPNGPRGE
jgi:hypothetical protein